MIIRTPYWGTMPAECLPYEQAKIAGYGAAYQSACLGAVGPRVREASDVERVDWLASVDKGLHLDWDAGPATAPAWLPTEEGVYIVHSYGRPDYWAIGHIGRREFFRQMISYRRANKPTGIWIPAYLREHMGELKLIPMEALSHKYLTTNQKGTA